MKPDWKDAPEWAKWLAMDEDGEWFWYQNKPKAGKFSWVVGCDGGLFEEADISTLTWDESLETRP